MHKRHEHFVGFQSFTFYLKMLFFFQIFNVFLEKRSHIFGPTIIFIIFWPNFPFTTSETMRDYYFVQSSFCFMCIICSAYFLFHLAILLGITCCRWSSEALLIGLFLRKQGENFQILIKISYAIGFLSPKEQCVSSNITRKWIPNTNSVCANNQRKFIMKFHESFIKP